MPRRSPSPRYKVLLVDDDSAKLRSLAAALEFDFDVVTCPSGELALTLLREQEFHAVCSDDGMSGMKLLDHVASLHIPVACLLLTGSRTFIDRRRTDDQYVLMKPASPARLSALLAQISQATALKRNAARLAAVEKR